MTNLDQQLNDLAARIEVPDTPVEDDLARGRRRILRTRLATGGAALATLAVIAAGATAAPSVLGADAGPRYAGGGGTPVPPSGSTAPAQPEEVEVAPSVAPRPQHPDPLGPTGPAATARTLVQWQRVLAEHLDPRWQHLVRYDARTNGNVQTSTNGSGVTSLGSKYGWQNAGEPGLGMLQLSVNAGWSGLYWDCGVPGSGWSCHDATGPDGEKARVAEHDGVLDVAVEHADGQVVALTADSLFGNNSTVSVSGTGLGEEDLVTAAADERLSLPGGAPHTPPLLPDRRLEQVGRAALLGPGESLTGVESYPGGDQPFVRAHWLVDGADRGVLEWNAQPRIGDTTADQGCLASQFARCVLRTVDGRQVLVGYARAGSGGGWQVAYNGPAYVVRVVFTPADPDTAYPLDRAIGLVLDHRFQPAG